MTKETISGMTVLTPDEGMILKSGYVYSEKVYLGKFDSADNWTEVPETDPREEEPAPDEEPSDQVPGDFSDSDAVSIIMGEV